MEEVFERTEYGYFALRNKPTPAELEHYYAEKYYQQAMALVGRMSEREKYRTRGGYYLTVREPQKAIEEYNKIK